MSNSPLAEPVDVLILTAAEAEDDAVRLVDEGGIGPWQETPGPDGYAFKVWLRTYRAENGREMRVALSRPYQQGGDATAIALGPLLTAYRPQCLAMCGVCAGNPYRTQLGDVIIADRVYRYDVGEQVNPTPGAEPLFRADMLTFPFKAQWTQLAQQFRMPGDAHWLAQRPRTFEQQRNWLLRELLEERDPRSSPDRQQFCPEWQTVVGDLERSELIVLKSGKAHLTKAGREHIQNTLYRNGGQLPERPEWRIHVGPLGTGNNLVRDVDIWNRLGETQQYIGGLDMEGSVIGMAAHVYELPYLVAKGVMDYAEPERHGRFRAFAARAAAEVLLGFLRKHLKSREGQSPSEILSPNVQAAPNAASPSSLLNARYTVVPFFEPVRRRELEILEKWCADDELASIRLFVGPGGTGKTRLFIEWAQRLRDRGWYAGFLPENVTDADLDVLRSASQPTLIVIDYAEARGNLLEMLPRLAGSRSQDQSPLRIALVAREAADWWQVLTARAKPVEHLLLQYEPVRLEPVSVEETLRQEAFAAACERFAELRGKKVPMVPVDLSDEHYGRMLYLHMAALAAVEGLPTNAASLLQETVKREENLWGMLYSQQNPTDLLEHQAFVEGARRMVAAVTLLGGVPSLEVAEDVNRRVCGPDEKHFCRFLSWLYPGQHEAQAEDRYIAGLEPDLLGETLVAKVLEDKTTRHDFLDCVFEVASAADLTNGFTFLGRISVDRPEQAKTWIAQLLDKDVPGRAMPAFEAAMAIGKHTAFCPIGIALAAALERGGTAATAKQLEPRLPKATVALREVKVWVTRKLLVELPKATEDEGVLKECASLLNNLSVRLSELGRREEALAVAQEAVERYRRLAQARPDAFLPNLATNLSNLGALLSELGRREEALAAAQEAVEHYRRLADERPDTLLPDLAKSLNNLGMALGNLGRRKEALMAAQEAVDHYRRLADERPNTFLPDLTTSLNNLGIALGTLGRPKEALTAAQEAVDHGRRLAQARPDAFLPYLAMSLNNLGLLLSELGRREEALAAAQEAVDHYRRLAQARPDAFLPDLAMSLNNLGARLSALGRREEALAAVQEAVEHYRRLADERPDAFLPDLALSLNNLGNGLSDLGRREEALAVAQEAVEIRRRLAQSRPDVFLPDLATSLNNLGNLLSKLGRREEALAAAQEAVEIYQPFVERMPQAFLYRFGVFLGNLIRRVEESGQSQEANPVVQKAMETSRRLAIVAQETE